jgi:type IV secretory pathway TraG/TraD family ATPase VirD4
MIQSGLVGMLNCYHVTAYQHAFRVFAAVRSAEGRVAVVPNLMLPPR